MCAKLREVRWLHNVCKRNRSSQKHKTSILNNIKLRQRVPRHYNDLVAGIFGRELTPLNYTSVVSSCDMILSSIWFYFSIYVPIERENRRVPGDDSKIYTVENFVAAVFKNELVEVFFVPVSSTAGIMKYALPDSSYHRRSPVYANARNLWSIAVTIRRLRPIPVTQGFCFESYHRNCVTIWVGIGPQKIIPTPESFREKSSTLLKFNTVTNGKSTMINDKLLIFL